MTKKESRSIGKLLSVAFIATLVFAFLFHILFIANANLFLSSDLVSFLTGARIVRNGEGYKLYDLQEQSKYQKELKNLYQNQTSVFPKNYLNQLYPYRNLPFVAFLFVPLSFLKGLLAYKIVSVFNLVLLVLFLLHFKRNSLHRVNQYLLVVISLVFFPVITAIYTGQITSVILVSFYLIYISLINKKSFWAGIFSGLLLIKVQYIFAFPFLFLLSKNKKEFFKGFSEVFVLFAVLSLFVSGTNLLNYPKFLWITESEKLGSGSGEVFTLFNFLRRLLENDILSLAMNVFLYVLVFYFYVKKRFYRDLERSFILTIFVTLIFGIHMIENDMLILLIPIFLMLNGYKKNIWQIVFVLVCVFIPYVRITIFSNLVVLVLIAMLGTLLSDRSKYEYEFRAY